MDETVEITVKYRSDEGIQNIKGTVTYEQLMEILDMTTWDEA